MIATINSVGGWPILRNSSNYNLLTYNWEDSLEKIYGFFKLSLLFSISIQPDANDTLVNRIYVRIHSIHQFED